MNSKIIESKSINGVKLTEINDYSDKDGTLSVLVSQGRSDAPNAQEIGEVYLVSVLNADTSRACHKHEHLDEFFVILEGSARFFLIDDREESSSYESKESLILSSENRKALFVPRGVYHAFLTLVDNTKLLAISNRSYDRNNIDVYQLPFSEFLKGIKV